MKAAADVLKGQMSIYPPKTIANSPSNPSGQWYERGWGVRYKGGGGRNISERLDASWWFKYDQYKFEAIIGTDTSYAPFVQGPKGTQAKAMERIGWRGVDTVANEQLPRIQEMLFAAVKRAIGI
jgi:hypothetical protein